MLPELSALKSIAITGTGDADLTHSDWIDFLESCEKYGIKVKFDL